VAACAVLTVGAPAAQAGVFYVEGPESTELDAPPPPRDLTYEADPGANRLQVSGAAGAVVFDDPVAVPAAALPADCAGTTALTCSLDRVQNLAINLGGDNDTIAVDGAGLPPTTVDGGAGDDRADYSARNGATIALNGSPVAGVSFNGVEDATGSPVGDTIAGSATANRLVGLGGDDNLNGGLDADTLLGGAGADALAGGDGNDVLVGGDGADTFAGGDGADDILAADGVPDTITCGPGEDSVAADIGPEGDAVDAECETVTGLVVPEPSGGPQPEPASRPRQQPVTSDTVLRAPVPVLAAAVAAPGARTAPSARLRVPIRQLLANALVRGVVVPVSCSEACGISVAVVLDRRTARKLDLAGRTGPAVLGTATARLARAGSRRLRVRLTQRARRALRPAKRSVRVTVQSLVSDAAGNGTLMQRRVTLRR
jgi:hypothetical protein